MKLGDDVVQAMKASSPSGPNFVKAERVTERKSCTMRICATSDATCVRRETSGIKVSGKCRNGAQE